jgi:IS30 family transposase
MRKAERPIAFIFFTCEVGKMGKPYRYLTIDDRRTIEIMWIAGVLRKDIANKLGMHTATLCLEMKRGYTGRLDMNQRDEYDAELAEQTIQAAFKRRGRRPAASG